jgi:hypothetical protein
VRSRGFLIIPMLLAIVFLAAGQNSMFRLSDPLDFLATGLGALCGVAQIVIWISWMVRSEQA